MSQHAKGRCKEGAGKQTDKETTAKKQGNNSEYAGVHMSAFRTHSIRRVPNAFWNAFVPEPGFRTEQSSVFEKKAYTRTETNIGKLVDTHRRTYWKLVYKYAGTYVYVFTYIRRPSFRGGHML